MGAETEKVEVVVPADFLDKVAAQAAALTDIMTKDAEEHKHLDELAPIAVDGMIAAGVLDKEKRAEAIASAHDPVKVIGTVVKLATFITQLRKELGGTKQASDAPPSLGKGSSEDPTVKAGSVGTGDSGDSADKQFLRDLGL